MKCYQGAQTWFNTLDNTKKLNNTAKIRTDIYIKHINLFYNFWTSGEQVTLWR